MTVTGADLFSVLAVRVVTGLVVNVVVHVICAYVFPKDPGVDELYQDLEEFEAVR